MTKLRWTLAALAAVALTACGSAADDGADDADGQIASLGSTGTEAPVDSSGANGTASEDPEEAFLAFADCMRDHGVEMEDPKVDGQGRAAIAIGGSPGDEGKMDKAQKACQPLLDAARPDMEDIDPAELEKRKEEALAFSQCMRDNGVDDFPDPEFNGDGGMTLSIGGPMTGDPEDPAFQKAMEACQTEDGPMGITAERIDP